MPGKVEDVAIGSAEGALETFEGGIVESFQTDGPLLDRVRQGLLDAMPLHVCFQGFEVTRRGPHEQDVEGIGALDLPNTFGELEVANDRRRSREGQEASTLAVVEGLPGQRRQFGDFGQPQSQPQASTLAARFGETGPEACQEIALENRIEQLAPQPAGWVVEL